MRREVERERGVRNARSPTKASEPLTRGLGEIFSSGRDRVIFYGFFEIRIRNRNKQSHADDRAGL